MNQVIPKPLLNSMDMKRFSFFLKTKTLRTSFFALMSSSLVLIVVGFIDLKRFYFGCLLTLCFVASIGLGGLFFTMLHHTTKARWSVVVRRIFEAMSSLILPASLLIIPVFFGLSSLYEWARHATHDTLIQHKSLYLNQPFFIFRSVLFFLIF